MSDQTPIPSVSSVVHCQGKRNKSWGAVEGGIDSMD